MDITKGNFAEFINVTTLNDIKPGDNLVISGDGVDFQFFKVKKVKVTEIDGTEIILDIRKNKFFNLGMYLEGKSWVRKLVVIREIKTP